MNTLLKAVISGFGMSLGTALFKQASKRLGWDEKTAEVKPEDVDDITEDVVDEPQTDPAD